jgi:hypothetical protein
MDNIEKSIFMENTVKRIYISLLVLSIFCPLLAKDWQFLKENRKAFSPISLEREIYNRADSLTGFDVQKYTITLSVSQNPNYISGNVLAEVLAESALTEINYELEGLEVSEVKVNGNSVAFNHAGGVLNIPLSIADGETFSTQVFYSGNPQLSGTPYNVGMYFRTNSIFTVSDPDAARFWWPCYDHPWDKAIIDLIITMRDDWKVAANGLRESIVDNGDGSATTTWRGEHPMTTYLACITAGAYEEIAQTALQGELPILNFVSPGQYINAQNDLAELPAMIDYFSTIFGRYPFEKYGNATVNMSTFSAMEHQTMTTLGNFIIDGNATYELIVAHELAHQWYGNAVSFLDFNDVWLSEGFATYSEHLWMDKSEGWQAACDYVNSSFHQYYNSWENINGPATIYDPAFQNYFAPPSYEKAASVLHMLRLKLGDQLFFQLLQEWFTTYRDANVVTDEFKAMAEDIFAQDLDQFFAQWIHGSGIPHLEYEVWQNPQSNQLKISARSVSPTDTEFYLDIPFKLNYVSGEDSLLVKADPQGYQNIFEIADMPQEIFANYNNWTLVKSMSENYPELSECLPSSGMVRLSWNAFSTAVSYDIYRRLENQDSWQKINPDPIYELSYLDETVQNNQSYSYYLVAVDEAGYHSRKSESLSAMPIAFSLENNLLVIDETRDGNGSSISPDDAMVDAFYNLPLEPFDYVGWDVESLGIPTLNDLAEYKVVFWHDDDIAMNRIFEAEDVLSSYIYGGGKLIISGWKTASAITSLFWERFSPGISLYFDNQACLISAESSVYPQLTVDPTKLTPVWSEMLPMISSFEGDFRSLYTGTLAEGANAENRSLAFSSGNLTVFGFPLYFMEAAGVQNLLQEMISDLLAIDNQDAVQNPVVPTLSAFPNPFNHSLEIGFQLPKAGAAEVCVYNIRGQKLQSIEQRDFSKGNHKLSLDAGDLSAGVYLLRLKTAQGSITRRITLIK